MFVILPYHLESKEAGITTEVSFCVNIVVLTWLVLRLLRAPFSY